MAKPSTAPEPSGRRKFFSSRANIAWLVFLGFVVLLWRCFQIYAVEGHSMEPTLMPGQKLILVSFPILLGGIHDGDIVVIEDPSGTSHMIKRVFKSAGEIVSDGMAPPGADPDYAVPPGMIYVLGDNREVSEDSRSFGPVPLSRVVGKGIFAPGVVK